MWQLRTALILSLAFPGFAGDQTITHETMWLMKRVGAPVPSPDGKWVITSVTEPAYDSDEEVADLWIVPSDGSEAPWRLTFSKSPENGVAWSPDSGRIAFSTKRDGDEETQIYILDLARGGEAVRVTGLTMGASSPEWSPDGKSLLFTSDVYPGIYDEKAIAEEFKKREERKYNARVYEGFPIRYWDHWLDDTRTHLFVQEAKPGAEARNLLAGSKPAESEGFGSPSGVWAPDGDSIVFSALVNRNEAAHAKVIRHLYRVPAGGGEPVDLTPGPHSYSSPRFRPDGQALYALHEPTNKWVYNLDRLAMFTWPSPGEPKILGREWDRSVGAFAFSPDSGTIYIQAEDDGAARIFRMDAEGGAVEAVVEVEEGSYSGLAVPARATEPVILANWQSHRSPDEVVRIDTAARNHRDLTGFNSDEVARLDARAARHFRFERRGRTIHNLLVLPPRFDESQEYPLVVFIHGGPHAMQQDIFHLRWNFLMMASRGYVVLSTNYTGSVGFGEKFAQAIQEDPLRTPGEEINMAVDVALARFDFIDETRIAAGGASYGGHLSNWLQGATDRYRCLYSHAGLISLEGQWGTSDVIYHRERNNGGPPWEGSPVWETQSPFTYAENFRTPVLLTIGEKDYRVPLNQTLWYWSVLKRLQVPSRLVVFPDANHWIMDGEDNRYFYEELLGWLDKYLK